MTPPKTHAYHTRRHAGLIAAGTACVLLSFFVTGPAAFMGFVVLGGGLSVLGAADFLRSSRIYRGEGPPRG